MRNNAKKKGGMWEYLDSLGVLERGIDEEIKLAKKAYRKKYFTLHKRKQRAKRKEYTIGFTNENGELLKLAYTAGQHQMKVTEFIKSAVMAYIDKTYVVPDKYRIAEIELALSQCLNEIQGIVKQKERFSFQREFKYERIESRIKRLETDIYSILRTPQTLEDLIIKEIKEKPKLKEQLINLLTQFNHDYQNQIT